MQSEIILQWASARGIEISPAQINALAAFQQRVLDVNKNMNLTAITDPTDFAVKHFIDSLTILPHIPHGAKLIDIGTGAGFPGMVMRITRPDLDVTLLDSTRKRVNFLREAAEMLGLPTECVHARAEEFARTHGGMFDVCTARAVAGLDRLAGWALPLVKRGGIFLAMKGPEVVDEIEKATPALGKSGGRVEGVFVEEIAKRLRHSIVLVKKIK